MTPEPDVGQRVAQLSSIVPVFLEPRGGGPATADRRESSPTAEPAVAERLKELPRASSAASSRRESSLGKPAAEQRKELTFAPAATPSRRESPPASEPAGPEQRMKPLLQRSAAAGRRKNPRLVVLRARVKRFEETVSSGGHVLSCDLVNLEMDLRVHRTGREMGEDDVRQTTSLMRRVQKLARVSEQRRAGGPARRRRSEGHGFVAYPTIGATPLAAGQMAHAPRTPNKGRPARSLWAFRAGLPGLRRR